MMLRRPGKTNGSGPTPPREIKVLSLASYPILPAAKGGQKMIALFNKALARELELHCLTVRDSDPLLAEGYYLHNIVSNSRSRYFNPLLIGQVSEIISREKITHIILEHPYWAWLATALKRRTGVRLLVKSQNIEAERFRDLGRWWWPIMRFYERQIHFMADHSFFITPEDRSWAIEHYGLNPKKCSVVTYGTDLSKPPADRKEAKKELCLAYGWDPDTCLLLYNGTLDYEPNVNALRSIITQINPRLAESGFDYKIVVCGPKLPTEFEGLKNQQEPNIHYAGFVDDITLYFKGCETFLNPVIEGGGIKTKLVEALAFGCTAVSTESGSHGIPLELTGGKLLLAKDRDWEKFASQVILAAGDRTFPPAEFYRRFSWKLIARHAAEVINSL